MGDRAMPERIELRDTVDRAAAIKRLRLVEPYAIGNAGAEDMAHGCHLLDVLEDGNVIGSVSIEIDGTDAVMHAASGRMASFGGHLDLVESVLRSKGVKRFGVATRRPGLVRRMLAHGYGITRCELEKDL